MHRAGSIALLAVLTAAVAALSIAGCSPPPSGSAAPPTGGASNPPGTATTPPSSVVPPSQTDTAWGRIWDALPPSFPEPPNARPATDTGASPSSAQLTVPDARGGLVREQVVQFYLDGLTAAGYAVNRDGPLEDGSVTVATSKGVACQVQASVWPIEGGVIVTVLYGAGCPFN
jgi:hypothetical protein